MIIFAIKKLIRKLRHLPVDSGWLKTGRERLVKFMDLNPVNLPANYAPAPLAPIRQLFFRPLPAAVFLLLLALVSGGGLAAMAQSSLPTDTLYPVKIATEQIEKALTFDRTKKIDLSTKLAEIRLDEIKKLQVQTDPAPSLIIKTLTKYQEHLAEAQNQLTQIANDSDGQKAIEAAAKLDDSLDRQREKIESLTEKSSPEENSSLNDTQKKIIDKSSQVMEKIENQIKKTENRKIKISENGSAGESNLASSSIIKKVPEYLPQIENKAAARIKAAENKLKEIRKKIDKLTNEKKDKPCPEELLSTYLEKLEANYRLASDNLLSAKKSFDQKDYLHAIDYANQVLTSTIDLDNLIGRRQEYCRETDRPDNLNCKIPKCSGAFPTGEIDENNCPVYLCSIPTKPEKECRAVFSNCSCSYKCVEVIAGESLSDCKKLCPPEAIDNYKPNCGYRQGVCGELTEKPDCPRLFPLPPDWCEKGKIIPGGFDDNGCHLPPKCLEDESTDKD